MKGTNRVPISALVQAAAEAAGLTVADIKGPCRKRPIVRVRQCVCWVARKLGYTYSHIGRQLGGRDHDTIVHSTRLIERLREDDPDVWELTDSIMRRAVIG